MIISIGDLLNYDSDDTDFEFAYEAEAQQTVDNSAFLDSLIQAALAGVELSDEQLSEIYPEVKVLSTLVQADGSL